MKAKSWLYAVTAAIACISCTREAAGTAPLGEGIDLEFTAEWADEKGADSRTVLQEDGTSIWWSANEEINVFIGKDVSAKFISTNSQPQGVASFVGNVLIGVTEQSNPFPGYWAAYPYNEENSCDGQGITMSLPDTQEGKANGFADKFFPSVARSNNFLLSFWNVCGGARFSVTQEGVTKIIFKSNDGSPMAGKVKVGFGEDNKPQILEFTEPVDSVVVNAPEGGFVPGENYFAAMLPQAHVKGMTISLRTQDEKASRTLEYAVTIHRSIVGVLDNVDNGLTYERFRYLVPEMVDLGLSVKWASFNLGATKPEEYGDYFAWGETEPNWNYNWSTYKWCKGGNGTMTKYCNNSIYGYDGFTDNKTALDPEDDAATVAFGGSWRMATYGEWKELYNNCTWTLTTQNGVNGRLVTGPNGNSIFLPAAGYRDGTRLYNAGSRGYYWSSSLYTDDDRAYNAYFDSGGVGWGYYSRFLGLSVRPVYSVPVSGIELNKSSISLNRGESGPLTATIFPSEATNRNVNWSSFNTSVAMVDANGLVTAVSTGTAIITATTVDGGFTAECTVTVKEKYKAQTPKLVDLGLPSGLKWASFNLGATKPEGYGDYFAWGETEPKSNYSLSTYKWCKGSNSMMTKYCSNSSYGYNGFTDNKTVLDPEDDAATVALGGKWRMPTLSEWQELLDNCTDTWITVNGIYGIKFTSIKTGYTDKWIFLPAAGYRNGTSLNYAGSYGRFWSSSLDTGSPYDAYYLGYPRSSVYSISYYRYYGQSVRPVSE